MIVIGLLGAIALIVIAAINPIEQANRARDTRFRSDAGQLISAIDRYFAANSEFPWMVVDSNYETDDPVGFVTAATPIIGVCGATCAADGVLITSSELKTEFRSRDFIQRSSQGPDRQILIGKATGSSASVYGCFIPLANSTKQTAVRDSKVYQPNTTTGVKGDAVTTCDGANGDGQGVNWTTAGCYVCIPD